MLLNRLKSLAEAPFLAGAYAQASKMTRTVVQLARNNSSIREASRFIVNIRNRTQNPNPLPAIRNKLHAPQGINGVLKNQAEVDEAVARLVDLGLAPHNDAPKNWDCYRAISLILNHGGLGSRVLDVGAPKYAVILPWLEQIGLSYLEACDLCYDQPEFWIGHIRYSRSDLHQTTYVDASFDFVTSISVIEHGVDLDGYFKEMSRILKIGGYLLTSTDYWPEPIDCSGLYPYGQDMGEMKIFTQPEVKQMIETAAKYGFTLTDSIDFSHQDKVVHWKRVDRRYTFIFFALRKVRNSTDH